MHSQMRERAEKKSETLGKEVESQSELQLI